MDDCVLLVRESFDGEVECAWVSPFWALDLCENDPENGVRWASARIVADDISMGLWDRSA